MERTETSEIEFIFGPTVSKRWRVSIILNFLMWLVQH